MTTLAAVARPSVPKLCPGGTVVCLASGPSLTPEDVAYVRGKADAVIAINATYQLAPWADVLYGCDAKFWVWHQGVPSFVGLKYSLAKAAARWPGVQVLRQTGTEGIDTDPGAVRTGRNSGYQSINVAVHLGATRIVLLGYDMRQGPQGKMHWHSDHPDRSQPPFRMCLPLFASAVEPLRTLGVDVVNCSRTTALTAFPRRPLQEVWS